MTAEEFERAYAARSGITVEQLRELGRVVRPCHCDDEECEGWQSVSRESAEELDARLGRFFEPGDFRKYLAIQKARGKS